MRQRLYIELPFPCSVNNLFVNNPRTRGRFPSKAYKAWKAEAGKIISALRITKPLPAPYLMTLLLQRPDKRPRDAENYIKAISDILVSTGVVEDDSQALLVTVGWLPETGKLAKVTLTAARHPQTQEAGHRGPKAAP
jgi:Holliday junction resolvase RusA-like endonuclease